MIDYTAMLAGLETDRAVMARELADVDAAIAVLRPLVNGKPPDRNGRPAKRKVAPSAKAPRAARTAGGGRGSPIPADVVAVMKAMYEKGEPTAAIIKATGRTLSAIYNNASTRGWKRGKAGKATVGAAAVTLSGTQLAGRVSCPSCHLKTDRDPCEHCGKPVRK